jgi:hypothetical protein
MHITVTPDILIGAAPARVFERLSDVDSWPQWSGNLVSMKLISDEPLRVGSQIQQVVKGGRTYAPSILEVTDYVPERSFGIKGANLEGVFRLEALDAATVLHAQFTVEAMGLAATMYRLMLRRFVLADLRKFKKRVESGQD